MTSSYRRHPFPGPGLAVRVLGDVTEGNKLDVLREADEIFINAIREYGLYDEIWQVGEVSLCGRSQDCHNSVTSPGTQLLTFCGVHTCLFLRRPLPCSSLLGQLGSRATSAPTAMCWP
jgi:hypothetical protein